MPTQLYKNVEIVEVSVISCLWVKDEKGVLSMQFGNAVMNDHGGALVMELGEGSNHPQQTNWGDHLMASNYG